MKVFLANCNWPEKVNSGQFTDFNCLQSYYFLDKDKCAQQRVKNNAKYRDFILDSGAFSYMNSVNGNNVDWDQYVEQYAHIVSTYNVKNFIEVDIDSIVGLKEVERLRNKLEKMIGRQCIPVWHKSRGLDYWGWMVKNYKYVAVGGIAIKTIKRNEYGIFRHLLDVAHKNGCRVHGLGFTNTTILERYNFDTVDSSSWNTVRFGSISVFRGGKIQTISPPAGKKIDSKAGVEFSFDQWVKFCNYIEYGKC